MEKFDIIVIGAGPGGYPAAIRAAQLGKSVAIVEREQLGGTCLNWGCIPTKLFISAAELYHSLLQAEKIGIKAQSLTLNYSELASHKDRVVGKLRGGVGQLLKLNNVRVFSGSASFQSPERIVVTAPGFEPVELEAGKFIIATGSTSLVPESFPKHERIVESRAFLNLPALPAQILVVGGGYIGCELACMAAHLGVKVTIVEMLEDILLAFDLDVRHEVRRYMEVVLRIRILTGHPFTDVQANAAGVSGLCGGNKLGTDLAIVAVGRRPVTEGLTLENAGLATNARGFIEVNEFGQTRVPRIYAIGDVNGGAQLAHAATSQGIIATENAFGQSLGSNETVIPGVVFTSPEIGVVGLSEQEAKRRGLAVRVGKFPFASLGRSIATSNPVGFAKWIASKDTDVLLGATVVGPHATELIAEAAVAIRAKIKANELGATIHAHPTFGEIWMEAAHAVHGMAIHSPPVKKTKVP
jgi:dihydrolipoamide dehydrogenase